MPDKTRLGPPLLPSATSLFRPATTASLAPCCPNNSAVAFPMPLKAPVITATLPFKVILAPISGYFTTLPPVDDKIVAGNEIGIIGGQKHGCTCNIRWTAVPS